MDSIPIHKITDKFHGAIAHLRHISEHTDAPNIHYPHRDDFYIMLFVEKGKAKLLIDFKEYDIEGGGIYFILPGQIHQLIEHDKDCCAWALIVESSLVKDEYKEIFEKSSLLKSEATLDDKVIDDLKCCITLLERRLTSKKTIGQGVLHSLLSAYIGIIAELYQEGFPAQVNKRAATITFQFKSLLSANYRSLKSPSQYADKMNISAVYLNEAVKETTGLTVSEWIRNEIVIQAKRLLCYTNMSIKEIALELGYEDWAYFTRIFSKTSLMSPTQFRMKYYLK